MILRDYQIEGVNDLRDAFKRGHRKLLYVAPCGSGKTVFSAHIIRSTVQRGNRVLFAAGRRELIDQTTRTLARSAGAVVENTTPLEDVIAAATAVGLPMRVIRASEDTGSPDAPVIVGSVQTLSTPRWRGQVPQVQLIILDEAHHAPADQYGSIAKDQPDAMLIGLSATPERQDGKPLGDLFDLLIPGPSISRLTSAGYLVPCRVWAGPPTLESGQLALTSLEAYQRFAVGQRAAIFCRDRRHAAVELEVFQAAGIPSEMVIGTMAGRKRQAALEAWRSGEIQVVTSVNVLTEGFDLPELGVAILARRFGHAGAFLQAAGRILRPAAGKTQAQLIDLAGSVHEHGTPDIEREYSLTGRAISKASRDNFGQCRECGAMFLDRPRACPHCGAEIPVRPLKLPRSTDVGVTEIGSVKPRPIWTSASLSKYEGNCKKCGRWMPKGTPIYSTSGVRGSARHQRCPLLALPSTVRVA